MRAGPLIVSFKERMPGPLLRSREEYRRGETLAASPVTPVEDALQLLFMNGGKLSPDRGSISNDRGAADTRRRSFCQIIKRHRCLLGI